MAIHAKLAARNREGVEDHKEEEEEEDHEEEEEDGRDKEEEEEALGEMEPLGWEGLVAALVMQPSVLLLLHLLPTLLPGESKELEPGSVGRRHQKVPPPKRAGLQIGAYYEGWLSCAPQVDMAYSCCGQKNGWQYLLLQQRVHAKHLVQGIRTSTAPYY